MIRQLEQQTQRKQLLESQLATLTNSFTDTLKQMRERAAGNKGSLKRLRAHCLLLEQENQNLLGQRNVSPLQKYRDYIEMHMTKVDDLYV